MHFALLGDHPDGLHLAQALVASGRYSLMSVCGLPRSVESFERMGLTIARVADFEEILADPGIEAVVVASRPDVRASHLRRALQSERHVLCVHPIDRSPDAAYEAAMLQGDTGKALVPILTDGLHPALARLAQWIRSVDSPLGQWRLAQMECWTPAPLRAEPGNRQVLFCLPVWDLLRTLAGDINEVVAYAAEAVEEAPLLVAGSFERGGLFQVVLVPGQHESRRRLTLIGSQSQAVLSLPDRWPGPSTLTWRDAAGEARQETWDQWEPWPALVEVFDSAVARAVAWHAAASSSQTPPAPPRPSRQDAIRCLELDDATRRSVERRRASSLEYQEATEEAGFKGTMTLIGCGLLWAMIGLLILSIWLPRAGWFIIPLLIGFLALQLLRWLVPKPRAKSS
jgi:predicted dehydrogenase